MAKKLMTFDEAVELLKGNVFAYSASDVEEAMRIVKDKEPNHPVLKSAQDKIETYKKENNLTENDANVYLNNIKDLEETSKGYDYDTFIKNNKDIKNYVDVVDIMEGQGKKTKPLSPKRKKEYVELMFETAKLKALTALAGSKEFEQKSPEEKEKALHEEIKNTFFADFARTAISSYIKMPTKKESKIGTKEYKQYILKLVQNAAGAFKNFIEGKKRSSVHVDNVLASCADSVSQVETYIDALKQKAKAVKSSARESFNKVTKFFQDKKNKLEKTANFISENRYEIWKNVKGSFKDNKIKLIGNVSASVVFGAVTAGIAAGTVGAPMTLAVGAYAAYHAAGAWVYPVVAEMRKINRQRREKGLKPLKFKEQLKQAWHNKTAKDEKKNSYKARNTYIVNGVVNTGLAAIGFGCLKDGLEAIDDVRALTEGVSEGINATQSAGLDISLADSIAQTKHAVSMGRIAIPLAGQFADAGVTYAISVADPDNKEKAAEAKQTAATALVGAGFSALAQGIGFAFDGNEANELAQNVTESVAETDVATETATLAAASANVQESAGGFFSKVKNFFSFGSAETTETAPTENIPASAENISDADTQGYMAADNAEVETAGNVASFPDEYNSEMGISQKEYNILVKTTEGTLKSATGDEITLDRAYANLSDETMANFPNQTREEVLYKFNRLYAFMRRAYEVGDGTLRETPSGTDYLEARFEKMDLGLSEEKMDALVNFAKENTYASKKDLETGLKEMFPEGLDKKALSTMVTTIHSNQRFFQHAQEMEALINLIGCGKELPAEEAVKVNALLEQTDELLKTGKENTVLTGLNLSKGCNDDDGEWRRVVTAPKLPVLDDEIEIPEPEIVIDDAPLELENKPIMVARMPLQQEPQELPVEEPKEMGVRKLVTTNYEDFENGQTAEKQTDITGTAKARRLLRRAGKSME